jgi:hypothetical protein
MADHIQIGDVNPRIQYAGDGAQTVFTYPFPVFKTSDMEVYLDDALEATGYTVNGAGASAGGDVTFDTAPGAGILVTLRRRLAIQRTSDFQESGEFRSKVINDELDYLTAALQQVSEDGTRALRLGPTDPTASLTLPTKDARADMFLAFDADGEPVASPGEPGPAGPPGLDGSDGTYTSVGDGLVEATPSEIAVDLATPGLEFASGKLRAKADGVTIARTAGGLAIPAGGVGVAELALATVTQAEAEAGAATTERLWTAERVAQAIAALGAGGMVPLLAVGASNQTHMTFETLIDGTYKAYAFVLADVHPHTNDVWLRAEYKESSTWQTAGYDGVCKIVQSHATPTPADQGIVNGAYALVAGHASYEQSNAAAAGGLVRAFLNNPAGTAYNKTLSGHASMIGAGATSVIDSQFTAQRRSTAAVVGVRFFFSSGNISGTGIMFGLKSA